MSKSLLRLAAQHAVTQEVAATPSRGLLRAVGEHSHGGVQLLAPVKVEQGMASIYPRCVFSSAR